MCLAVPMKIIEIAQDNTGVVDLEGTRYNINFSLIENPQPNEYIIVHAGFAIEKLDTKEADLRLELFQKIQNIYKKELGGKVKLIKPLC